MGWKHYGRPVHWRPLTGFHPPATPAPSCRIRFNWIKNSYSKFDKFKPPKPSPIDPTLISHFCFVCFFFLSFFLSVCLSFFLFFLFFFEQLAVLFSHQVHVRSVSLLIGDPQFVIIDANRIESQSTWLENPAITGFDLMDGTRDRVEYLWTVTFGGDGGGAWRQFQTAVECP